MANAAAAPYIFCEKTDMLHFTLQGISLHWFSLPVLRKPHVTLLSHLQVPVPLLKEKIATVTGILSEQQRLICRGRVLKDDELLSAYPNTSNSGRRHGPTVARSVVLEAVNVDPGSSELPAFVAQILQSVLGTINAQSTGTPTSSDTGSLDPSQSSIPNTIRVELDQQQAPLLFQSEPAHESSQPNVIPDALTTMSQYINFMRDSFRREGFSLNGQTEGNVENRTAEPESASVLGLHNASLLAENMHSTRQIIVEQAGALLSVSLIFQNLAGSN
ncbi:Ubiquitin-like superfamily protein [Zea mays]|uniref:Ubiquitin-like superfamily protein n=1 Tax=Zea mays TaxID=4577 RepID=A0A1D6DUV8_MAIZE|nr:Ubiquitin-like superfamily protein [Zea mays]